MHMTHRGLGNALSAAALQACIGQQYASKTSFDRANASSQMQIVGDSAMAVLLVWHADLAHLERL